MNAGIYFTMAGSWAVGLRHMGIDIPWHVCLKPFKKVFSLNFPDVPFYERIEDVPIPNEDIIVGSPPCIGMSVSNPKACMGHAANQITLDFARVVVARKPLGFVMEMVPTFLGPKFKDLYQEYEGILMGEYNFQSDVIDFANFAVPQHRKRSIIIGVHKDVGIAPAMPQPVTGPHNYKTVRETWERFPPMSEDFAVSAKLTRKFNPKWKGPYSLYMKGPDKLKLKWDEPAPTVVAINTTYWKHPSDIRLVTWQEAAALQQFPRDYQFVGSYPQRVKQAAWGVPCLGVTYFIQSVIDRIMGV